MIQWLIVLLLLATILFICYNTYYLLIKKNNDPNNNNPINNDNLESSEGNDTEEFTRDIVEDIQSSFNNNNNNVNEKYYNPGRGFKREQMVCQTLEQIYGKGFPTRRPSFLRNPETGELLEYDCFNEELRLAAEHNGEHHYVYPNTFHRSEEEFSGQLRRDSYKLKISEENGIYLIRVPYWVPMDDIPLWIRYHLPESVIDRQKVENLLMDMRNN